MVEYVVDACSCDSDVESFEWCVFYVVGIDVVV